MLRVAGMLILSSITAACTEGKGGPIAYSAGDFGRPDAPTVASLGDDYRIAPMDTVTVKIFKMPDLSGDYEVDLTGKISMPLVGDVPAADMTTAQLDQEITQRYGAKYLQNPDVSVGIKASTRRSVTVDGSVKATGSYPLAGPTTLMQAVALAGGTSEDANVHRVAIFRTIDGKRQAAAFDLGEIRRGKGADPQVYAGDIIVVDGSRIKALQKQILSNLPFLSVFGPL
nr:polysaccharide biosynthesis/export family protein [uncultured Sphingomonas sp.]